MHIRGRRRSSKVCGLRNTRNNSSICIWQLNSKKQRVGHSVQWVYLECHVRIAFFLILNLVALTACIACDLFDVRITHTGHLFRFRSFKNDEQIKCWKGRQNGKVTQIWWCDVVTVTQSAAFVKLKLQFSVKKKLHSRFGCHSATISI
jgi:hypothetical protein